MIYWNHEINGKKGLAAYERKHNSIKNNNIMDICKIFRYQNNSLWNIPEEETIMNARWFSGGGGHIQPTKLSSINDKQFFFSLKSHIFSVEVEYDYNIKAEQGNQGKNISDPLNFTSVSSKFIKSTNNQLYDIQSLASKSLNPQDNVIASVDEFGGLTVNRIKEEKCDTINISNRKFNENSWTGVSFLNEKKIATVHTLSQSICIYDIVKGTVIQDYLTELPPMCISNLSETELFAICEWNKVSLWDSREKSMIQSIKGREETEAACLYGLSWSEDNFTIAVGGQDKKVYFYDTRTMKLRHRMNTSMKYDIIALEVSKIFHDKIYVVGRDNEIMCDIYTKNISKKRHLSTLNCNINNNSNLEKNDVSVLKQRQYGFRGDSRWLGTSIVPSSDINHSEIFFGVCESGSIYTGLSIENISRH